MGIVKMQSGNRNARQGKRLHEVNTYALTLREIHLEHAIVDYQAVSSGFGRRCTQIGSTWTRDVPWRCLEWRFGFQVNFTKARCDRTAQKGIRPARWIVFCQADRDRQLLFSKFFQLCQHFPIES